MVKALAEIYKERLRQEELKAAGRFSFTCADDGLSLGEKLAVLGEEFGEVARAVLEAMEKVNDVHGVNLRKELIQVAAVAMAWAESL